MSFLMQDNSVECFRRACKIFSLDSEQVMCSMYDLLPTIYTQYVVQAKFLICIPAITNYTGAFDSVVAHLGHFWPNYLVFRK